MSMHAARPPREKRPAKPQFTSMILVLEGVLVLFAGLTAYGLRSAPAPAIWSVAGSAFVVLVLLSRLVTKPGGYVAGSVAQLAVIACGVIIPLMYALGVLFAALWFVSLRLGARVDAERAEFDALYPDQTPYGGLPDRALPDRSRADDPREPPAAG
ncbi:DUF4233 domain-containing protein [Cellulomonas triticagri]|uniref:DUF4233 domain-containing protein n=1 Tax=Cellulomonas triticagri TaxID=2483352 RepID=A0A3M2JP20_9CELL|nr:DUF4233 domain-containing protein [Cellulomonas triticagri]RMI13600.1 DUF4233 domain-containing protein [Cellulomonas triticagri]